MKLLEVDEAANHIRELVDADANIIWGSAFNPDLEGRVRVSVVATGIDQDAIPQYAEPRPLNLGAGRAPKRPVLPLPSEAELAVDAPAAVAGETPAATPVPQSFEPFAPQVNAAAQPPAEPTYQAPREPSFGGYGAAESEPAAPQAGADEPFELTFALDESQPEANAPAADPVEQAGGSADDGLLRDADRLAAEDAPVSPGAAGRRRGLLGGGAAGGGAAASSGGGSTLFERMANLSRSARNEEDDDDDGGSALNIPRFLGRQNNQ